VVQHLLPVKASLKGLGHFILMNSYNDIIGDRIHEYTNTQIDMNRHEYTNTQIDEYTRIHEYTNSSTRIQEYRNTRIHE